MPTAFRLPASNGYVQTSLPFAIMHNWHSLCIFSTPCEGPGRRPPNPAAQQFACIRQKQDCMCGLGCVVCVCSWGRFPALATRPPSFPLRNSRSSHPSGSTPPWTFGTTRQLMRCVLYLKQAAAGGLSILHLKSRLTATGLWDTAGIHSIHPAWPTQQQLWSHE